MRKLQNNFTTPEQSKRLLELGVPEDSADQICYDDWSYSAHEINISIPCWSVGRLMEIYVIAMGLDTAYIPIERGEDIIKYLIRLYEEKVKDLDFSKLEE